MTTPKGARGECPSDYFFVDLIINRIVFKRFIIPVIKLTIVISSSICRLLSVVFPFGNYILAYSAEYVKEINYILERTSKKDVLFS